jgi:hypothetical protein
MPPVHVAWLALAGTGQGAQLLVPQALTSAVERHSPLQACVPGGHAPLHALAESTHTPLHSFLPESQIPPHIAPAQVAVPSIGAWQGVHDLPHVRGSSSRTHVPAQACWPPGHPAPPSGSVASPPAPAPASGASGASPPPSAETEMSSVGSLASLCLQPADVSATAAAKVQKTVQFPKVTSPTESQNRSVQPT